MTDLQVDVGEEKMRREGETVRRKMKDEQQRLLNPWRYILIFLILFFLARIPTKDFPKTEWSSGRDECEELEKYL